MSKYSDKSALIVKTLEDLYIRDKQEFVRSVTANLALEAIKNTKGPRGAAFDGAKRVAERYFTEEEKAAVNDAARLLHGENALCVFKKESVAEKRDNLYKDLCFVLKEAMINGAYSSEEVNALLEEFSEACLGAKQQGLAAEPPKKRGRPRKTEADAVVIS